MLFESTSKAFYLMILLVLQT